MERHHLGKLWPVSALTLGGGGLGMVWGETTFEECVATVHAAVAAGIDLLDLAPRYGDGKAEEVVGAAFAGKLPAGVRVTSKCNLGELPPAEIEASCAARSRAACSGCGCRGSICSFCTRMSCPMPVHRSQWSEAAARMTLYRTFVDHVRPVPRAAGRRGVDRRLGVDRHRPSRHDHPARRRDPGAGGGAVHRQSARTRRAG